MYGPEERGMQRDTYAAQSMDGVILNDKLTPHLGATVETAVGLGKELRIGFRHLQAAWRSGVVLVWKLTDLTPAQQAGGIGPTPPPLRYRMQGATLLRTPAQDTASAWDAITARQEDITGRPKQEGQPVVTMAVVGTWQQL